MRQCKRETAQVRYDKSLVGADFGPSERARVKAEAMPAEAMPARDADGAAGSSGGGSGGGGGGDSGPGANERWEVATDPVSQRPYFYNRASGVSRWDMPPGASILNQTPK